MKTIIEIKFKPKRINLLQIEDWLIKEEKEKNEGFYCNWNVIEQCFNEKRLAILTLNNDAIGFISWSENDYTAGIVIMEINPKYRKQYYGHLLFNQLQQYFLNKGIVAIQLDCSPASSEKFWEKLNFIDFPTFKYQNFNNKHLYRIIIPFQKEVSKSNGEIIELWEGEPYETANKQPDKIWEVKYQKGTNKLKIPIIAFAHYDWRIRWRKGDEIFIDDKVKYFGKNKIYFNRFIVINDLII